MEHSQNEIQAVQAAEPQPVVATIGVVVETAPIEGADRIQVAVADCGEHGRWTGVVGKDMAVGDTALVLLQDALLPAEPDHPRWGFMRSHKFRVRMARFKGVPSECLILPAAPAEQLLEAGTDVGPLLGIIKYSKPIPAAMAGKAKDNFPSFIPKTDEPNFQRVRDLDRLMSGAWYATEKADGTSCTAFVKDGELRVCSRNWELEREGGGVYWEMAEKYSLERIPEGVALQFEIIGPGVQANPMGLEHNEIRVFTGHYFGPQDQCVYEAVGRMTRDDLLALCGRLRLPTARLVDMGVGPRNFDQIRKLAEITYPNGKPGEGVVMRCVNSSWSFKAINLLYKD